MSDAVAAQAQLVANIVHAPDIAGEAVAITDEMREILETAGQGIDTDGDGLSDIAETNLTVLSAEFVRPCGICLVCIRSLRPGQLADQRSSRCRCSRGNLGRLSPRQ